MPNEKMSIGTTSSVASLNLASATTSAGGIAFGTDTNLFRSAANTLRTDDNFHVGGGKLTIYEIGNADEYIIEGDGPLKFSHLNGISFGSFLFNDPLVALGLTSNLNGIAATSTNGVFIQNETASTSGVPVQISPRIRFRGSAWKTDATAASQWHDWTIENITTSQAIATTSTLRFGNSLNGASYTFPMSLTATGNLSLLGSATASLFIKQNNGYGTISGSTQTVVPANFNSMSMTFANNVTLTLSDPSSSTVSDGHRSVIRIKQDATGSRTLTWGGTNVAFGTDITSTVLTTTASKTDIITVLWDHPLSKWFIVGFVRGF